VCPAEIWTGSVNVSDSVTVPSGPTPHWLESCWYSAESVAPGRRRSSCARSPRTRPSGPGGSSRPAARSGFCRQSRAASDPHPRPVSPVVGVSLSPPPKNQEQAAHQASLGPETRAPLHPADAAVRSGSHMPVVVESVPTATGETQTDVRPHSTQCASLATRCKLSRCGRTTRSVPVPAARSLSTRHVASDKIILW
jgi:hypothetical protein